MQPAARFIGRTRDLASIAARFAQGARLVTIWGPAGMGKTRLALQAALEAAPAFLQDGQGGVWFCDLSEARDVLSVSVAIARCLDVPVAMGKRKAELIDRIGSLLGARGETLLLLDNLEQVVGDVAPAMDAWLRAAPELRLLVTSRERSCLPAEIGHELVPLLLPGEPGAEEDGAVSEAEQLFLDRIRAQEPDLSLGQPELVRTLVSRLDGIPLAIELAAARFGVLGLEGLVSRLGQRLDLLSGGRRGVCPRQMTLRSAIDWSWDLLDDKERQAFTRCSIFHGGFSLDAAAEVLGESPVAALDRLQSLRDKSLLRTQRSRTGEARFSFYAGIAEFASEKRKESGEEAASRLRHAAYFLRAGEEWAAAFEATGALRVLDQIALELENLLAIVDDAGRGRRATGASIEEALRALLVIDPVLTTRGPFGAQIERLDRLLLLAESSAIDASLHARALAARGRARQLRGLLDEGEQDLARAREMAARTQDRHILASILMDLGVLCHQRQQAARARALYEQALSLHRGLGDHRAEGRALGNLGALSHDERNFEDAVRKYERALAILSDVGDLRLSGIFRTNLGLLEQERGGKVEARRHFETGLAILEEVGDRRLSAIALSNLGNLHHEEGRLEDARVCHEAARCLLREVGDARSEGLCLGRLGAALALLDRLEEAETVLERADLLLERLGDSLSLEAVQVNRGFVELARHRRLLLEQRAEDAAHLLVKIEQRIRRARRPGKVGTPSLADRSDDIRSSLRILERNLAVMVGTKARHAKDALLVSPNARWLCPPGGTWQDLRQRSSLRGILEALIERHRSAPGQGLPLAALQQAGWPGESIRAEAAANRIHVALSRLRQSGLREVLLRTSAGYHFAPGLQIESVAFEPAEHERKPGKTRR